MKFATTSTPQGAAPLSSDEIQSRLTGLSDIASLLQGKEPVWSTLAMNATNVSLRGIFGRLGNNVGLDTLNVSFDQAMNPQATLITSEFGQTKYSAFRLGIQRSFSSLPTYNAWLDYHIPDVKLIRNFAITAGTNERHERTVNLQYKFPF